MQDLGDYNINQAKYDWAARTFQSIEGRLGLNIKVHGTDDALHRGEIFLFNHFARFETVIPPYVLHRDAGAYCRSVADHHLFSANESLGNTLREVGAVPNNLPGLLPFLAAEILRGRKVIIFPEGGMIKDRRVLDEQGAYGVFSPTAKMFRKHHRGAAVLAVMLEIFKRRIRDVFEANNERRMEHWRTSLGFSSLEALREAANKPTFIVPGTITFHPIRIDDNILTRGLEFFSKKLSRQVYEELAVEGNIILRDTDMDIRLGSAITPELKWRWWERMLLSGYFEQVDSLDALFGLREEANRMSERILVRAISKETDRLRDAYMEEIYKGVTVNLSHLASQLILTLLEKGRNEIAKAEFQHMLYITLKGVQKQPEIHLHRSLCWPDRYRHVASGEESEELSRFMETCQKAHLIKDGGNHYKFLPKLKQEHSFHEVRLENPVLVSANEVAPIKSVQRCIDAAIEKGLSSTDVEMSAHLFDDELRAYSWNRGHYSKKRYEEVNARETATQSGEPYLLLDQTKKNKTGVVLVHGFLASPAELRDYGEELFAKGYPVMGVRLTGHGTSPWDLKSRRWQEWMASVRRGVEIMSAYCDNVVVVGFSTGAALSLMLATEKPKKLAGIASISAPLAVHDKSMMLVPVVHTLNKIASFLPNVEEHGLVPFHENDPKYPEINYRSMPVKAVHELRVLMSTLKKNLQSVELPTLIVQGTNDYVVHADSAEKILKQLGTDQKMIHWVETGEHHILSGNIGDTRDVTTAFIQSFDTESTATFLTVPDNFSKKITEKLKKKVKVAAAKKPPRTKKKTQKKVEENSDNQPPEEIT